MSTTRCTGIRKDGQPCQANGLEQYGGLCLAHGAPPEQAREWRSRGGKNSATAVRRDNRMPEQLKHALDIVQDSMDQLAQQEPTPAICNAISRSAQTLINIRRRADEEMELIRAEEIQAAAADIAGAHPDLDVLEAAADIKARLDRFSSEALVEQGYAEFKASDNPDDPPDVVLNGVGRLRFGYHCLDFTREMLVDVSREVEKYEFGLPNVPNLPIITGVLLALANDVDETLSTLAHGPETPVDPLTGLPFAKLPHEVKFFDFQGRLNRCAKNPQQRLTEQRAKIKDLQRRVEELDKDFEYLRIREERAQDPDTLKYFQGLYGYLEEQTKVPMPEQAPQPEQGPEPEPAV